MTSEDLEFINLNNVLEMVENLERPTRAVIAGKLGLSRTTLTNITNQLFLLNILTEAKDESFVQGSRGKPGTVLRLKTDYYYVLGGAFYSENWHMVLCTLDGKIEKEYVYHVNDITPENLVKTLIKSIHAILELADKKVLNAIGLGLPGVVNGEEGKILWAYDLKWNKEIDIKTPIEKEFGFKVYSLNRYTLAGLAEFRYANPNRVKDMIYVGLGSGIRSAIFVNGELLLGSSFSAGRVGHIQIDPNGEICECGKRGCLLALANEEVLIKNLLKLNQKEEYKDSPLYMRDKNKISIEEIGQLSNEGDKLAREAIDSISSPIIQAIGMLVDIINPKMIVLGGPIGYSSNYLVDKVRKAADQIAIETPYREMIIKQGEIKNKGSSLGAASLVLDHKLELILEESKKVI